MGTENGAEIATERYGKGDVIFRCGDKAECMYEVLGGSVGIYADYGTPEEKLLTRVKPGGYFGEMAMVEGMPRSATAVALSMHTEVRVITWMAFGTFFRERPATVVVIMQNMGRRIRELTKDYTDACRAISELADRAEREKQETEAAWINDKMRRYLDSYRAMSAYENMVRE